MNVQFYIQAMLKPSRDFLLEKKSKYVIFRHTGEFSELRVSLILEMALKALATIFLVSLGKIL